MNFDATQLHAIDRATRSTFHIINGGAGTGKTTIIKSIAQELTDAGEQVNLCAFAGKAAARLREATGFEASTIHRMLQSNGTFFMAGQLTGQSVILDEASMVDIHLMSEITKRNPKRLILVGDQAQLTPVGKGQPFHDLINCRPDNVTTLTTCYRATEAVFNAASQIRSGQIPPDRMDSPQERWVFQQTGDAIPTHKRIMQIVQSGGIDFDQDIILVARNGESDDMPCAVRSLNQEIVNIVNPRQGDEKFAVGDRVINTKNFSEFDVWNGTTGTIDAIDTEGCIWVHLDVPAIDTAKSTDDRKVYTDRVLFNKDMRKSLQLAYALTVHKSQGSQYRRVLIACIGRDTHTLLDRSLIYTAATRTREMCCVVGDKRSFVKAVGTVQHKRTVIQEIVCGGY